MHIAELVQNAGLPPGVLNVVNGDKAVVDTLLNDLCIQVFSFVGSAPITEYIYSTSTANAKCVQALGGAKNRDIVIIPQLRQ